MYSGNLLLKPGASPSLLLNVVYYNDWVTAHTYPNIPTIITIMDKNWITGVTNASGAFASYLSSWNGDETPEIIQEHLPLLKKN